MSVLSCPYKITKTDGSASHEILLTCRPPEERKGLPTAYRAQQLSLAVRRKVESEGRGAISS